MKQTHCPICYSKLVQKNVAPCDECGGNNLELEHYKEHKYHEYILYHDLRLVLCDYCDVDFGSFDPTYFGFTKNTQIGYQDFQLIREVIDIRLVQGKFCEQCGFRLPFLNFIRDCRIANEKE